MGEGRGLERKGGESRLYNTQKKRGEGVVFPLPFFFVSSFFPFRLLRMSEICMSHYGVEGWSRIHQSVSCEEADQPGRMGGAVIDDGIVELIRWDEFSIEFFQFPARAFEIGVEIFCGDVDLGNPGEDGFADVFRRRP